MPASDNHSLRKACGIVQRSSTTLQHCNEQQPSGQSAYTLCCSCLLPHPVDPVQYQNFNALLDTITKDVSALLNMATRSVSLRMQCESRITIEQRLTNILVQVLRNGPFEYTNGFQCIEWSSLQNRLIIVKSISMHSIFS